MPQQKLNGLQIFADFKSCTCMRYAASDRQVLACNDQLVATPSSKIFEQAPTVLAVLRWRQLDARAEYLANIRTDIMKNNVCNRSQKPHRVYFIV